MQASKHKMAYTTEEANSILPSAPHGSKANPLRLCYCLIAEPKFGKTTWFSSFPDSLLLAFEQGHAFINCHKVVIDKWDAKRPEDPYPDEEGLHHMTFMQAVDRFKFVFIDTADMAAKMCTDYHTKRLGIDHPSEMEFGKGYELTLATPFRQAILQLLKSGRGVGFITHINVTKAKIGKAEVSKKESTLPNTLAKFIIPQCDLILHGKFGRKHEGSNSRDRIIVTEGSDSVLAGNRVQKDAKLPAQFVVDADNSWEQWESFFQDPANAVEAEAYCARRLKGEAEAEPEPETTREEVSDEVKPKKTKK